MTQFSNGKTERHYFEAFRLVYSLPEGSVVYGDKPDVIIQGKRTIGIEITNFFLQSGARFDSEQRQRAIRGIVVDEAHKLYLADGGKGIELTFNFDKNNPIPPGRRTQIARYLADLAHRIHDQKSGAIENILFRQSLPEVSAIWLNAKAYKNPVWRDRSTYGRTMMRKDNLEAIVREKESKAAEYEGCDAHWLLIVVDAMDSAQQQEIRIDDPRVSSSVFERILIYDTFGPVMDATE